MGKSNNVLTEDEMILVRETVKEAFLNNSPKIGVIGVSGVGKSSTINSLFKTNLATSETVRCTTQFKSIDLEVEANTESGNQKATLRVFDAPGLGEDIRKDQEYLDMYKEYLPKCDVILWVMTARNRAIALDQMYLEQLIQFRDRIIFGINQIDLVDPLNWNTTLNIPSKEQSNNINIIIKDRQERLSAILGNVPVIVPYGAKQKYRLVELFEALINHCTFEKRWMFSAIKKITPAGFLDNIDSATREKIISLARIEDNSQKSVKSNFISAFLRSLKTKKGKYYGKTF